MRTSQTIGKVAAAIARAQAAMNNPTFDSDNPYFKSKYASLAAVRNAVIPALSAEGVAVIQDAYSTEHGYRVTTLLAHGESGEWIESAGMDIPVSKDDAQGAVAAVSYGKRVDLQAVTCVVGDTDDDGNEAAKRPPVRAAKPAPAPAVKGGTEAVREAWEAEALAAIAQAPSMDALHFVWGNFKRKTDAMAAAKDKRKAELQAPPAAKAPAIQPDTASALEGDGGRALPALVLSELSRPRPRTIESSHRIVTGLVGVLGSDRWAAMVKSSGGDVTKKFYGLEAVPLEDLAALMVDAARGRP